MIRREFIDTIGHWFVLAGVIGIPACTKEKESLNILVLGGTLFVGPAIVNAALTSGHKVTLFNRGITSPGLFIGLPWIKGDREQGPTAYEVLKDRDWDIVIDVWPEKAILVDHATQALKNNAKHYIFISSIAVYKDFQEVGLHEQSEVVELSSERSQWYYAEEKLAAENMIAERFHGRHTILRPGPIKGWRDPAVDLYYWCLKLTRDNDIIAPGSGDDPLQFIDVDDVGRFAIMASEQKLSGIFNVTGPQESLTTWREFLAFAKMHFDSNTELLWASERFLKEHNVASFSDLPLWAPLSEDRGFMQISNQKLIDSGFEFTPLEVTLDKLMKWNKDIGNLELTFGNETVDIGLNRNRELELINQLKG